MNFGGHSLSIRQQNIQNSDYVKPVTFIFAAFFQHGNSFHQPLNFADKTALVLRAEVVDTQKNFLRPFQSSIRLYVQLCEARSTDPKIMASSVSTTHTRHSSRSYSTIFSFNESKDAFTLPFESIIEHAFSTIKNVHVSAKEGFTVRAIRKYLCASLCRF